MRATILLALLVFACRPRIDYTGTEYQCPDGVTCPSGFTCIDARCTPDDVDASAPSADAPPAVDAPPAATDAPIPIAPSVSVPAGPFLMGCSVATMSCPFDAVPERTVTLGAYELDRHEVTQLEYQACVAEGACVAPLQGFDPVARPAHPVVGVTWDDALSYCAWAGKRLPTEAEWEKGARGGDGRTYPWGDAPPDCARVTYSACPGGAQAVETHVGDASPFGATEMAGNVAEWVADWYSDTYYFGAPDVAPPGPPSGTERVVRGGGFSTLSGGLRSYVRDSAPPSSSDDAIGFRCAR